MELDFRMYRYLYCKTRQNYWISIAFFCSVGSFKNVWKKLIKRPLNYFSHLLYIRTVFSCKECIFVHRRLNTAQNESPFCSKPIFICIPRWNISSQMWLANALSSKCVMDLIECMFPMIIFLVSISVTEYKQ